MKKILSLASSSILLLVVLSSCCDYCGFCKKESCAKETRSKKTKKGKKVAHRTTAGLTYEILKESVKSEKVAHRGDKVTVHYTGWIDENGQPGKKIDSSVDRNQPFSFTLGKKQVIVGFDEGISDMKVGEQRRLIIPSHMAYGPQKVGNIIPANSTLIFDVELINVA